MLTNEMPTEIETEISNIQVPHIFLNLTDPQQR